jgi:hypothetical protein
MSKTPTEEAVSYIEDRVKGFQDVSEIAWRFLIGNRILEKCQDMDIDISKGTDMHDVFINQDEVHMKFGSVMVIIKNAQATKPNSGDNSPESQLNSE